MTKGFCRTRGCAQAFSGLAVEYYPGPGEFCPECGEQLEAVEQADSVASAPAQPRSSVPEETETVAKPAAATIPVPAAAAAPKAGAAATPPPAAAKPRPTVTRAAETQASAAEIPVPTPAKAPPKPQAKGRGIPAAALAFAGTAVVFVAGALYLHLSPPAPSKDTAERVCATSMTQRIAAKIVAAYAAKSGTPTTAFDLVQAHGSQQPCDVRFMALAFKKAEWTIGYDAIVAVVNPRNPLNRITGEQLRAIFAGTITNWSQLGGSPATIVPKLPDEATDEAWLFDSTVLSGVKAAAGVQRLPASSDVVRAIASASGRDTIGLVAFSQAAPAKMLALGDSPVPSTATIADNSYPLAVSIMVTSDYKAPDPKAAGLIKYALSAKRAAIASSATPAAGARSIATSAPAFGRL